MSDGDPCTTRPAASHELSVSRHIAALPAHVRRVWEERLAEWYCPRPWRVEVERLDLRPGGASRMRMLGPNGEVQPNDGIVLEATDRRIVMTDAFQGDWQPAGPFMVGIWEFAPDGEGTRVTGTARHWTADARDQHEQMGFEQGWSAVLAQLATLAEGGSLD